MTCSPPPKPSSSATPLSFPIEFFGDLESLIGKELQGRIFSDSRGRRVKFQLDLTEHLGFQIDEEGRALRSPWYDDSVLKE
jgi:hypothetical protein